MKKELILSAALASVLCLSGCNNAATTTSTGSSASEEQTAAQATATASTSAEQLKLIQDDFTNTIKSIEESLDETKSKVGNTYESYKANKSAIADWHKDAEDASNDLFDRTRENGRTYFKLLGQEASGMEWGDIKDALTDYYRAVYEDAMSDYYRAIYTDAPEDLYRTYYDGVLKDAYDSIEYSEYNDETTDFYRDYDDATTLLYRAYSDATSDIYRDYSDVYSAFYKENYSLDGIFD